MDKTKIFVLILFITCQQSYCQTVELLGKVKSTSDVENIHIINKTAQKFTITNIHGTFRIAATLNDTIIFTSVQHKTMSVIVDDEIIKNKTLVITLEEQINELDQVVVGKILTGNMLLDVSNVKDEPMTSLKAGIPSYQGRPKTQSERRLNEATTGGGFLPLNPILNAISGRTKELKNRIKLEEKDALMQDIKVRLSVDLFSENPLAEESVMEFFYFVSEQPDFLERCKHKTSIEVLDYLIAKLKIFKQILNSAKIYEVD
ncbi:hypothetical protein BZARG_955 [Bizionia argentinensis JUB59]|uniref:Carboxypeptidase-like regulatory domain-containing protein n=1 Tax=Bizionia argentinensis JUB59 TaxID=1046627 RepID=G2EBS6_9FLAO|nr:hypothetical protein [Bizionia argentinensis]EGV44141.1 hypothetical protein BZARG_955 [Bizionia argentinensis JUB59]